MDFDSHAETYRSAVQEAAGVSVEKLAGDKARRIVSVLSGALGDPTRLSVLDLGCGIGLIDCHLQAMVGEVYGVDVSWESLRLAAQAAPVARFVQFDGKMLPFANATFDAVIASCVLHHVPPAERSHFVAEMVRPLRQGGIALIIEHNALNPVTRRIVSRCAFDADAVLLTCREAIELFNGHASVSGWRYMGFVPFRNTLVERAEGAFGWLPIGAQYLVWAKKTG